VIVASASDIARRDFAAAFGHFISAYARACSYQGGIGDLPSRLTLRPTRCFVGRFASANRLQKIDAKVIRQRSGPKGLFEPPARHGPPHAVWPTPALPVLDIEEDNVEGTHAASPVSNWRNHASRSLCRIRTWPFGSFMDGGPIANLRDPVLARGSTLMDLIGIEPSGAARLLVDVGDIHRFADRDKFASWNGTAPLDASSDKPLPGPANTQLKRRVLT
jgi:Transposase IS116/IS110/IS902 family